MDAPNGRMDSASDATLLFRINWRLAGLGAYPGSCGTFISMRCDFELTIQGFLQDVYAEDLNIVCYSLQARVPTTRTYIGPRKTKAVISI
jgi:hypothetical protein